MIIYDDFTAGVLEQSYTFHTMFCFHGPVPNYSSSMYFVVGSRTICVRAPIERIKNGRISLISIELRFGS